MKEDKATARKPRKTRTKKPKPHPLAVAGYTGGRETVYNNHFEFGEFRDLAAKPGVTVLTTAVLDPFDPTIKRTRSNRTASVDKDREICLTQ